MRTRISRVVGPWGSVSVNKRRGTLSGWAGVAALPLLLPSLFGTMPALAADPLRVYTVAGGRGVVDYRAPVDGAPATRAFVSASDLAPTPDGGFVLANPFVIYRVDPMGRIARIAGGDQRQGYSGDGGPARDAAFNSIEDVAVTGDGGLLIADSFNCVVRHLAPSGTITTVAGHRYASCGMSAGPPQFGVGDGGPATSAILSYPSGVAPTSGGGFLIVDSANQRIRRVDGSGTIRTLVGNGMQGEATAGYGGPAAAASVRNPGQIAALDDGGFLFTDANGIHRVSGDGTLSGILRSQSSRITEYMGLTEGGVAYRFRPIPNRVRVFGPGPLDLTLTAPTASFFEGDGDPLRNPLFMRDGGSTEIEPTFEGGLLFATAAAVKLAAPSSTRILAVAVARESLPALRHRRLRVRSTRTARVEVTLRRRRVPAASSTVTVACGLTTVRLPRELAPGLYFVLLRASTPEGAVAVDRLPVLVGPRLPGPIARAAHRASYFARFGPAFLRVGFEEALATGEGEDEDEPFAKRCHRFSGSRVDCVVGVVPAYEGPVRRCLWVGAATLTRSGYIYTRPYRCPAGRSRTPFKRSPRWSAPARQTAPLSTLLLS
jgi:hypothetical protein